MLKNLLALTLTLTLGGISGLALAKHDNKAGGISDSHISATGMENSNGQNADDRDKGKERAADRHSDKSDDQSGKHADKHHGKK